MIGDKDTTAIGKDLAPASVRPTLGNYPALGKAAAARFPQARLIEFPDLGHSPQIQAPARFHAALLGWLNHPEAGAPQTRQGLVLPDSAHSHAAEGLQARSQQREHDQ